MNCDLMMNNSKQKTGGFSLVEVIVVLVILGVLSAIAIPSYSRYLVDSRRIDAKTSLADLAARLEQHYTETNDYSSATIATGDAVTDIMDTASTSEGHYTLSISAATAGTYTIKATRVSDGLQSGDGTCGDFTLNSIGVQGITGSGAADDCW